LLLFFKKEARAGFLPKLSKMESAPGVGAKMSTHEIELKLSLTEPDFAAARRWERLHTEAPQPRARRLKSVYYDTAEGDLERHRMILRLRAQGRRQVMTFKWLGDFAGGAFERGEVEVLTAAPVPEPEGLGPEIAQKIAEATGGKPLVPVFATNVMRVAHQLRFEASEIEVAFDRGVIKAGERSENVCEVEMELKSGDPAALYGLGRAFAEDFPARLGCMSKAERGNYLRTGNLPSVRSAATVATDAMTVDAAIGACISACVGQFIGNWPAFERGDRARSVHQMRVAMRRLRSVLGLFQRAFPNAAFAAFRDQAKEIAAAMSDARDWGVFIALIQAGPLAAFPQEAGFAAVLAEARAQRDAGDAAVAALLASPGVTRFVLAMQAFVAQHGWRSTLAEDALQKLTQPAKNFAARNLERQHGKLLRHGKNFSKLSPELRHELRKNLKKLRYTADFFGESLVGDKYASTLARLQNRLGEFNDQIAAQAMTARLPPNNNPAANRAAGLITGWCAHSTTTDNVPLRKAWKTFRRIEPLGG
jgi:triphosphatase